jgi:c-di-GMP-binding flagellar brake protein YcgR
MKRKERRSAVRVPAKLAMEVQLTGRRTAQVETLNVSANGVYFSSSVHIPLMTRLEITLILPGGSDDRAAEKRAVTCTGIVVRTDPEEEQPSCEKYEVACFFTSVPEQDKEYLESYILKHIPL